MPTAAIYARVSSARQKEQQTIQSQTAALLAHAAKLGLDVPAEWVFEDEGCSGATLVRPALERLRDLVCQVPVEVVLCHAPDRLARKYAYQALLVEEFARAGTEVCFVENVNEKWPHRARQKWPHPRGLSGSAQPRWVANRDGPGEAITASLGGSFLGRAGRP